MADLGKRERDKLARMPPALDRADQLLDELLLQGLQRLSRPVVSQLQAAEMVAHNASLTRIERELSALGTQATRYLERDPQFSPSTWLDAVHRARLLVRAAREAWGPEVDPRILVPVVGSARRQYDLVDQPLELQAVSARGWVTDSDYMGLTVYLRGSESGATYQVTLARPTMYFGTQPARLLHQEISDHHTQTVLDLAHGAWRFSQAKVSHDHRLSLHRDLVVSDGTWQGARAYSDWRVDDWLALVQRLTAAAADSRSSVLAYVEPAQVSAVQVDEKDNLARCRMTDVHGAWLEVQVDLLEHTNLTVDNLQLLTTDRLLKPDGWFGRAWIGPSGLCFEPWSALYREPVVLMLRGRREIHALHLSVESAERVRRP